MPRADGPHNVDPTWIREMLVVLWLALLVQTWLVPFAGVRWGLGWSLPVAIGVGALIVCWAGGLILILRHVQPRIARTDREPAAWPVAFLRAIRDLLAVWGFIQVATRFLS